MNKHFSFCFCFLLLIQSFFIRSQAVIPQKGPVFDDNNIPKVEITIHPDSLAIILNPLNNKSDVEYSATFIWIKGATRDTFQNIGFRLRGNTSRNSQKKSFKIKFDSFGGKNFYGLTDLNLNGEHNDPSIIRSKLSWDLYRLAKIEAPRANHIALYINQQYMGLYINVENIDDVFLTSRNKNKDGQLFKLYYGADFAYQGNNPINYSTQVYEAANQKDEPDYYSLAEFTRILNDVSNPDYVCNLERIFDVDKYLRVMAMEVLIGHWDNPIYNKNNGYLYFNTRTKKYELLSYDTDNTFGIDWFNIDWATRNIYSWAHPSSPRPIYNNILKVPAYRIRYGYYMETFLEEFFNPSFLNPYLDQWRSKLEPYRSNDEFASSDYGFTFADFIKSYTYALTDHVKYGLKEYIDKRSKSAFTQLQNTHYLPYLTDNVVTFTRDNASVTFTLQNKDPQDIYINYRLQDATSFQKIKLQDDGNNGDVMANDHQYYFNFPFNKQRTLEYYVTATSQSSVVTRFPLCDFYQQNIGYDATPLLFINEFMVDNTKYLDESGEAEDWIEIYNGDEKSIFLGDLHLSDDRSRPSKWRLPNIDLASHEFIVIWADEDGNQGDRHANFKLSKSGEFIGIFDAPENFYAPIDTLTFSAAEKNVSLGKLPDGEGPVIILDHISIGKSNLLTKSQDLPDLIPNIYPNPSSNEIILTHLYPNSQIEIFNMQGLKLDLPAINVVTDSVKIDVSSLLSGNYQLIITSENRTFKLSFLKINR